MSINYYDTVVEGIEDLKSKGYTLNFSILADSQCMMCGSEDKELSPDEFRIDDFYRFDGMTNPEDDMILYAISSMDGSMKGTLLNGYGTYSDENVSKVIERLEANKIV